ncbi:DUF4435 domain-containing protein [Brucella pseudogrignonensis]|uniref:DUF4435 domain-containing protein n=1 Tax=Brucella pseudogrignonensis TaxID=419475 RepID=UPI003D95160B
MLRAATKKTILIVEGPSDYKLLASFIEKQRCDIVIAHGKSNSIDAIKLSNGKGVEGALAIVDKDFDSFLQIAEEVENLIYSDDHDIEVSLIKSPALEKVLTELGSDHKIKARRDSGDDIREKLLAAAHPIGVARLYSLKNGLSLVFEGFKFRYISKKFDFDTDEFFNELKNHSKMQNLEAGGYNAELKHWEKTDHDRWEMCCGHDLCRLAGLALQSLWGSRNTNEVSQAEIESRLRLAFEADHFRETGVYIKVKEWEACNPGYVALRL